MFSGRGGGMFGKGGGAPSAPAITYPRQVTRAEMFPYFPWDWESANGGLSAFTITETAAGVFTHDYDVEDDRPTIAANINAFWSPSAGNDGTAALNDNTKPYLSIAAAVTAGARRIRAMGTPNYTTPGGQGVYEADRTTGAAATFFPNYSFIIEPEDGVTPIAFTRAVHNPSWAQESAPNTAVYSTTLPAAADPFVTDFNVTLNGSNVYLPDGNTYPATFMPDGVTPVPIPYRAASSIADCQSKPGSWFRSTTKLYVHTPDGRAPDAHVKVLSSESVFHTTSSVSVNNTRFFAKHVWFMGKTCAKFVNQNSLARAVVLYKCAGGWDDEDQPTVNRGDGFDIDNSYMRAVGCYVGNNPNADGFSGHHNGAYDYIPHSLYIDCYGGPTGYLSGGTRMQVFTEHDKRRVIRINCRAFGSYAENFGDVLGTHVIMLGCDGAKAYGAGTASFGFGQSYGGFLPCIYLRGCTDTGNSLSLKATAATSLVFDCGENVWGGTTTGPIIDGEDLTNHDDVFVPEFTVTPQILGTTAVSRTLTFDRGASDGYGPLVYTYQALKKDAGTGVVTDIVGSTASTYVLQAGDEGYYPGCRFTTTNSLGNASTSIEVFAATVVASDTTTPDDFDFTDQFNLAESTQFTSNLVEVQGYAVNIDVTSSGGQYRLWEDAGKTIEITSGWTNAAVNTTIVQATHASFFAELRGTTGVGSSAITTVTLIAGTGEGDVRFITSDVDSPTFISNLAATGASPDTDLIASLFTNAKTDALRDFYADLAQLHICGIGTGGIVDAPTFAAALIAAKGTNLTATLMDETNHSETTGLTTNGTDEKLFLNYDYGAGVDSIIVGFYGKSTSLESGSELYSNLAGADSLAAQFLSSTGIKIRLFCFDSNLVQHTLTSNTALTSNVYFHLMQVVEGGEFSVYKDGAPDSDTVPLTSGVLRDPTVGITIGGDGTSDFTQLTVGIYYVTNPGVIWTAGEKTRWHQILNQFLVDAGVI